MPENGQHSGGSPCEQQRQYPFTLPLSTHIGTLAMVPGEEHDISSALIWQVEHHSRLGIEGVQKQQRVEDRPSNVFPLSQRVRNLPVCFSPICPASPARQLASSPETVPTDALTMDWAPFKGYAFPLFNLISAVLNKESHDKADIILVAPIWPPQLWWPLPLSLLIKHSVLLPSSRHLLRDPADPQSIHPMFSRLHLAVFHVSWDSTRKGEFQTMLRRFSFRHPANVMLCFLIYFSLRLLIYNFNYTGRPLCGPGIIGIIGTDPDCALVSFWFGSFLLKSMLIYNKRNIFTIA